MNKLRSKHSLLITFDQCILYYKIKHFVKKSAKAVTRKLVSGPYVRLQRIKHNLYWKMNFLKQATYIRYVIAKVSKFVQISMQISSDSSL